MLHQIKNDVHGSDTYLKVVVISVVKHAIDEFFRNIPRISPL